MSKPSEPTLLYTFAKAGRVLGYHAVTIRRHVRAGIIKTVTTPSGREMITRAEIRRQARLSGQLDVADEV